MDVPIAVWIVSFIIVVILSWITFWITNKAYSRRWEDHDDGNIR